MSSLDQPQPNYDGRATSALPPLATKPLHYGNRHWCQTCRLVRDILSHIVVGMLALGIGRMAIGIGRRRFISALGGAAVVWPLGARAQQPAMPVIGFLNSGSAEENTKRVEGFRKGLGEAGFVEGRNVAIEFRWAGGQNDRLPDMIADLIRRRVAVIATVASTQAALVAKAATPDIPIVFAVASDPVALGLVPSLNRPGGNVTGIATLNADLAAKRLGLLRELVPKAARVVVLVNPSNIAVNAPIVKDATAAAATQGLQVEIRNAGTDGEIEAAFAAIAHVPGSVVLLGTDPLFYIRRAQIAALAARHAVPAIYDNRDYAAAGGLMSYGPDAVNFFEQAGVYVGRVLKGEKPADLPVVQSAKFELVINLHTARELGINVPPGVLSIADDVIE
jgi:ABC-type uncharacterized transport system substrate-binding protein